MKSILKSVLRKLGLLKVIRTWVYRRKYKSLIHTFAGQTKFPVHYRNIDVDFSIEDPYSATFFATYFRKGVYEEEGLSVMLDEVNPDDVVFDVGANIGYFTCLAAIRTKSGEVHAFEMGHENFNILEKNIRLNQLSNAKPVCMAVSDDNGKVSILDSPVGNAVTKILEDTPPGGDIISVPSISLDAYSRQSGAKPDFVKIDVEGAEMKVLQGMRNILKDGVKLLVEIHDKELKLFHSSKQEVLDFIAASGYSTRIITNDVRKNLLVYAWRNQ